MYKIEDGLTLDDIHQAIRHAHHELHPEEPKQLVSVYSLIDQARHQAMESASKEEWKKLGEGVGKRGRARILSEGQIERTLVEFTRFVETASNSWSVPRRLKPLVDQSVDLEVVARAEENMIYGRRDLVSGEVSSLSRRSRNRRKRSESRSRAS